MNHLALSYLKMLVCVVGLACVAIALLAIAASEETRGADVIVAMAAVLLGRQLARDLKRIWRRRFITSGGRS